MGPAKPGPPNLAVLSPAADFLYGPEEAIGGDGVGDAGGEGEEPEEIGEPGGEGDGDWRRDLNRQT